MKVSDLFHAANRFLALQAVNRGLNRGVGGAISFRKIFLNFAYGGVAAGPQRFHDLKLQLGEFRTGHLSSYRRVRYYYIDSRCQEKFGEILRHRFEVPAPQRSPKNIYASPSLASLGRQARPSTPGMLSCNSLAQVRVAGSWETGEWINSSSRSDSLRRGTLSWRNCGLVRRTTRKSRSVRNSKYSHVSTCDRMTSGV